MLKMRCKSLLLLLLMAGFFLPVSAQRIVYSEPDKDDTRRMDFDIVGKVSGNFLIYKNLKNRKWVTVLDNEMNQIAKEEQAYMPDNDRLINTDFFPYSDFAWMIYQYQRKNVVYCMAAKINGMGKMMGELIELDTTHIGFASNNKVYSVLTSEDKKRIGVFKINSKNKSLYFMTTLLFDDGLSLLKRSRIAIPMEERNEHLSDFSLDNEGDMVFSKFLRTGNDNISSASFITKKAMEDTLRIKWLNTEKTWLDEIHIKVDNYNKRYFLTSFYYKERRGNIDGFYFYIWDKVSEQPIVENVSIFSDELRKEARGDAGMKTAFNDYFIRNIITRRDGGFLIGSEAFYTTSRFNSWNRWDYLYGSPYWSPGFNNNYYSPYYDRFWWGGRSNNQSERFHADNITLLSFDKKGQLEWSNVISKSQFDDETDNMISYQLMNTGGQVHVIFNQLERRNNLLTDFSISPDGKMERNPTLKNLDKGYEFMPKFGKQVSARQLLLPCIYRNYICFAKIEYN